MVAEAIALRANPRIRGLFGQLFGKLVKGATARA